MPRWWDDRIFYEIFVRSFQDSDGDGIGDLRGVIQRLDYLNDGDPGTDSDLGITGIWLMPVFDSPSYHGYDTTDYRRVNPQYGTNADLTELVAQAHARGIAVILDLAINHTSDEHPWFRASSGGDSKYADWYRWIPGTSDERGPWGQLVWHPLGDRSYFGLFSPDMPDLNLTNPEVTDEVRDIARFWIEGSGIDGYRFDGAQHLIEDGSVMANTDQTRRWLADMNAYIHRIAPGALTVGEVWSTSAISSSYVPEQFDLTFDFEAADAAADLARSGAGQGLVRAPGALLANYPDGQAAVFTDNHDRDRLATLALGDPGVLNLIATWQLAQRGTPFLFYGQEIGLVGRKPDEQIRSPMSWTGAQPAAGFTSGSPWEPLAPGWQERNVAAQSSDARSLWRHYRDLIAIRDANPELRHGDLVELPTGSDSVFAYLRRLPAGQTGADQDSPVLIVGNASSKAISNYAIELPQGLRAGNWEVLLGDPIAQPLAGSPWFPRTLAPWESLVLRLP